MLRTPERLVRDLPHPDAPRISLGELAHPLLEHALLLEEVAPRPFRGLARVVEDVALRLDAVLLAPVDAEVRRRAAVDLRRVLRVARLALLGLEVLPVERHRRQVERRGEMLLVRLVLLLGVDDLVQHEEVGAILEVVGLLRHLEVHVLEDLAVLVLEGEEHRPLAVELNAGLDARVDLLGHQTEEAQHAVAVVLHGGGERARHPAGGRHHDRIPEKLPSRVHSLLCRILVPLRVLYHIHGSLARRSLGVGGWFVARGSGAASSKNLCASVSLCETKLPRGQSQICLQQVDGEADRTGPHSGCVSARYR